MSKRPHSTNPVSNESNSDRSASPDGSASPDTSDDNINIILPVKKYCSGHSDTNSDDTNSEDDSNSCGEESAVRNRDLRQLASRRREFEVLDTAASTTCSSSSESSSEDGEQIWFDENNGRKCRNINVNLDSNYQDAHDPDDQHLVNNTLEDNDNAEVAWKDFGEGGQLGNMDQSDSEVESSDNESVPTTSTESDSSSLSDTENEDSDDDEEEHPTDQPLYNGSQLSSKEFFNIFLAMHQRHNFSSLAMNSILKLFQMSLPSDNQCPPSSYKFEKGLSELGYSFTKYSTCFKCQHLLQNKLCSNEQCNMYGNIAVGRDSSIFYTIELFEEMKRFIAENLTDMQNYVNNYMHHQGVYKDILDGEVYRRQSQLAKADGSFCISLYWHLDGAPALKSKNISLWPIQSFVAEMPPNLRYSFKNIVLSGLWYGRKKPEMRVFQNCFVEEVKVLRKGFQLDGTQTKVKIVVSGQVADLMAKGPSINCKVHNGRFGCSVCLHAGRRLEGPGNKRVYEYFTPTSTRRNHADFLIHAQMAEQSGEAVFGVKGTSPVHEILQIPDMVLLDYMHQVLEGEYTRRFTKWLKGTCPSEFRLDNTLIMKDLERKLQSICLPHDFKRKLRTMEDFKKWKASEKQTLFLHVGLPLMKEHLPPELFYHHCLLVTGVRVLCEDSIGEAQICIADAMLSSYTRLIPSLLGISEATYNSHSLTHLADQVRGHGPLILHSGFVFESMLAHLKRLFHGTRGIPDQIIKKLAIAQHATGHVLNNVQGNRPLKEFAEQLLIPSALRSSIMLNNGIKFLGPLQQPIPIIEHHVEGLPDETDRLYFAQRMIKGGQVYHCSHYVRKKDSVSYLVQFEDGGQASYGKVIYFLKDGNDGCAVVNLVRNLNFNISQKGLPQPKDPVMKEFWAAGYLGCHFTAVKRTLHYKLIKCFQIVSRIVLVENGEDDIDGYVSSVLKSYQHD